MAKQRSFASVRSKRHQTLRSEYAAATEQAAPGASSSEALVQRGGGSAEHLHAKATKSPQASVTSPQTSAACAGDSERAPV
eukprot:1448293-Pleurochrysis_carterae.AAC.1